MDAEIFELFCGVAFTFWTYVWIMFLSYFILNEKISMRKIMGVAFVLIS